MNLSRISLAVLALAAMQAQESPKPKSDQKAEFTFSTGTNEVLLDLVVRDRHDKLVNDLTADEVEIRVDGVRQTIRDFRLVSGREQIQRPEAAQKLEAAAGRPAGEIGAQGESTGGGQRVHAINLVAIVFSNMSPKGRDFARTAALEFLSHDIGPDTYVAVFSLDDSGLHALQGFTNVTERLVAAVNHAATGNYSQFAAESMNILNQIDTHMEIMATGSPSGAVITSTTVSSVDITQTSDLSTAGAEGNFSIGQQLLGGILHQSLLSANYAYGMRTLTSLMVMTKELARLPGRKTILYMSEGMVLPAENTGLLDAAISAANRSNVSFYTIDTRGLMTTSTSNAANNSLRHTASVSRAQNTRGVLSPDQFKQDDATIYAVKAANTQGPLGTLAENTGGFLIANTNDMRPLMSRIMEDVVVHYEVAFSPTTTKYDGKFRAIEVKLARKGLHAQSRSGFFDLPFIPGQNVMPYELLALQALSEKKPQTSFPFHAEAFRFHPGPVATQCSMAFEVPIAVLKSQASEGGGQTEVHVAFVALVKNSAGQIVTKISRDVPYQIPNEKFAMFRNGNVIATETFEVPKGVYSIESAVVDRIGQVASTKRSVFVVKPRKALSLSDITFARRIDPLREKRNPHDPMEYEGGRVTPALSGTVKPGEDASLYLQIYPNPASHERLELKIEFLLDGQSVASATPELPNPAPDGTISFVATTRFNTGSYLVRATVKQGDSVEEESSSITVQ